MDAKAQDQLDILPLMSLVSKYGGWPLLQNARFEQSDFEWEAPAGRFTLLGIGALFRLFVHNDLADSSKLMLMASALLSISSM